MLHGVIRIRRLEIARDGDGFEAVVLVVGVRIERAGSGVGGDVAVGVVDKGAGGGRALGDAAEAVRTCG